MSHFPSWVPDEVVNLHRDLKNQDDLDSDQEKHSSSPISKQAIKLLGDAMQSDSMERTWKAVARRSNKSDPSKFAELILDMYKVNLGFTRAPDQSTVAAWQDLAEDIGVATKRFEELAIQSDGIVEPTMLPLAFAWFDVQSIAKSFEYIREELMLVAGHPDSATANRVFLVRVMAHKLMGLYEQPLYAVVADTVALMLGEEPLDVNHVMKLVKSRTYLGIYGR